MDQTANMLGALSITLASEVWEAINAEFGATGETGAAVVLLGVEPLSIADLAGALGITHSGGVRLVNRLVGDGLAERQPNPKDSRAVLVALTSTGHARRERALGQRAAVLEPVLDALTAPERVALQSALRKLLEQLVINPVAGMQICRLCDESSCVPLGCPVEDRYQELTGRS
ncbi:MAG: MarR family winged helix-turn-helix transcriptional regulator [Microbacterium sp.]